MKTIDVSVLKKMFLGGATMLEVNKAMVDALNVFPVPDGDTGTNMSLTINSAVKEINTTPTETIEMLVKAYSKGALKGARGNSGVILSQIMKGVSNTLSGESITTKDFSEALSMAAETAYNAVTKPKEGTILTVIRVIAENGKSLASKHSDFVEYMEAVLKKGNEILAQTPEMLPVLKKAGVVDAGGKGLLCILEGFYYVLAGKELPEEPVNIDADNPMDKFSADEHDFDEIKYAYCTEYFVVNLYKTTTEDNIDQLRDTLMTIGDCVIVIGDLSLVKVHVHTNEPNRALQYALKLGELDKIKVENMLQQNRELMQQREANKKPVTMLSICAGNGIRDIFKDLQVDIVIEGGQTMNPSVDDILSAIEKVNSDNVIVLPNNSNIILAAEQAKELTKKSVKVIPTKNVPQGISAAIAFDGGVSIDDNAEMMSKMIESVICGQVTYAVRTTEMDGFDLVEGDIIGLDDKKIIAKSKDVKQAVIDVINQLITEDASVVTLYYGDNVTEEEAKKVTEEIQSIYNECEIMCYRGGQPHYFYLISIE